MSIYCSRCRTAEAQVNSLNFSTGKYPPVYHRLSPSHVLKLFHTETQLAPQVAEWLNFDAEDS